MRILISMTVVMYSVVSIVGTPASIPGPYQQPNPCAAAFCGGGQICEATTDCSYGSCRMIANCVPRPTSQDRPAYQGGQCSRMNCPQGTSCVEVSNTNCFRYPCGEVARCIPRTYPNNNNNNNYYNNNNNNNNRPGYGR